MRLGIVYDQLIAPIFPGGGGLHSLEVVKRLAKEFEITYFPSSRLFLRWGDRKEEVLKKVNEVEKFVKVAEAFPYLLDKVNPSGFKQFFPRDTARLVARAYSEEAKKVDFLYEPDHTSLDIFYLAKYAQRKFGITLQATPYYEDSLEYLRKLVKTRFNRCMFMERRGFLTRYIYNETYLKPVHKALFRGSLPSFISSVSEGPIIEAGLDKLGIPKIVLRPGNAFEDKLLRFRNTSDKEDYILYFGVLAEHKGVLELPEIFAKVRKKKDVRLVLMGKFSSPCIEKLFWKKISSLGLDKYVEYLGFIDRRQELERFSAIISRAKALIYPTHADSFSLAILESLALGTPAISYDIPGVRSIYSGLRSVELVNEFDIVSAANKTVKILDMNPAEYESVMNEEKLEGFLKLYSSWDNVAEAERKVITYYSQV
ncbi:glycosyltransferase family 4 protein [Stygiolobus caldivivus]|uniref:Glycosyl transferase family 1 domain-containing protein n=1 Tax=Stygiolobus caldivivus TaxID=2824673 RepID=A0A8D5ZJ29_9CREN|nr:glycosyltransferase family 4 protein [Stygiolobus caldivivus]BCU70171.1 hypothetical protein KN1_14680 [Stygiolobus caldivivus]